METSGSTGFKEEATRKMRSGSNSTRDTIRPQITDQIMWTIIMRSWMQHGSHQGQQVSKAIAHSIKVLSFPWKIARSSSTILLRTILWEGARPKQKRRSSRISIKIWLACWTALTETTRPGGEVLMLLLIIRVPRLASLITGRGSNRIITRSALYFD